MLDGNDEKPRGGADKVGKARAAIVCSSPDEMLQPAVCSYVGEILGPWLARMGLSPLELLTDSRALTELKKSMPVYTAAIATGAQLQVSLVGGDIAERAHALELFAEEYFRFVSTTTAPLITISPGTLNGGYRRCLEEMGALGARRHFLLSLVHYLDKSPSWGTKVERLTKLLETCTDPSTIELLDELLAGILEMEVAIEDAFVDEKNPFALLNDFMGLIVSLPEARRRACRLVKRLTKIMAEQDLKYCRAALQNAFQRTISFTKSFSSPDNSTGRKLMLWELSELSKLNKKMVSAHGWFAGDELIEAMEKQVARRTGILQLDRYTDRFQGTFAKTIELLRIYPLVFGEKNLERILGRIAENVTHKDLTRHLAQAARAPMEQLSFYGILEQKIRKAKLPVSVAEEMCRYLADQQENFIRDKQVFHKFRHLRSSSAEKGVYMLEMLVVGAFTVGRCRRAAIKLLLYFLSSKLQLMEFLDSSHSSSDHEERSEELIAMYDYFVLTMDEAE